MKLRHLFIPNKQNNYHPIALRPVGLGVFLGLFILSQLAYNVFSVGQMQVLGYATNISVPEINNVSNQERTNAGLPVLSLNGQLNSAALAKANDMFTKNYWAHNAPDGKTPWAFILESGYSYSTSGENLAKDFNTSSGVVSGWMNSASHRANILNSGYQDVGYAVVNGTLQGVETTLVVAMYASRQAASAAVTQPATTTPLSTPAVASEPGAPTNAPEPTATAPVAEVVPVVQAAPTEVVAIEQNSPTKQPIAASEPTGENGFVQGVTSSLPVQTYQSMNWGQKVSLALLCTLLLLFVMKHTLVWRQQKKGYRHIWLRAHPLGQASLLSGVIVATVLSGVGSIL